MARSRRRSASDELNPWPGYVDALSTLLMVIIFVLLVFVLAQAFLSVALSGRDRALEGLNRRVAELTDLLSLERGRAGELQLSVAGLNRDLQTAAAARDGLARDLQTQRNDAARASTEAAGLRTERDRLSARLADAELQSASIQARTEALQARLADAAGRTDTAGQDAATVAGQLAEARRSLAALRTQAAAVQADLDRTVQADRATIEARVADIAKLNDQLRSLSALRDELERKAADAAARATTEAERSAAVAAQLADEQKLSTSNRAQVALLTQQIAQLKAQMTQVASSLNLAEASGRDKDAQIANLGSKLNAALASKVEELQRYRSEFFGRLREVLANRPGIQVVGDRFVFQSEVLFPPGSADMTPAGQDQIRALAATLKDISKDIPRDINWILRVDGHADRQPVSRGAFPSNWELSSQRAINVVKLLVDEGVPPNRLAATGFGEFQPLDGTESPASYARNRRIELRLTDR
ncbi:MAG: peptidoglycan -binding protein [Janthinobacterium lividum]